MTGSDRFEGHENALDLQGEWKVVKKGGLRNKQNYRNQKISGFQYHSLPCASKRKRNSWNQATKESVRERFNRLKEEFERTHWWVQTRSILSETFGDESECSVQCLGLGSFEQRQASLHQLACASLIQNLVKAKSCSVSDPCMTESDIQLLADLGFTFKIACNVDDIQIETGRVVLFMPHCGKELNMAILHRWVDCSEPGNVVYFGNILSSYLQSIGMVDIVLSQLVASNALVERRCPNGNISTLESAFNDLAVVRLQL